MGDNIKRFKSRKKNNFTKLLIISCLIISFLGTIRLLNIINNQYLLDYLFKDVVGQEQSITFNSSNLLNSAFNFKKKINLEDDEYNYQELESITNYIEDQNIIEVKDPIIYIYNTHQLENYSSNNVAPYNITPNVLMASYIFREMLENEGIKTLVETNDITALLKQNKWSYSHSYKASRYYIEQTLNNWSSIKYMIDLHRDSAPYKNTTTTIDGKNFARVMFVIGLDHDNYINNLKMAEDLNNYLNNYNKNISRGVVKKGGKGVNGIYNQDLNKQAILIEVGGQYNSIEEVTNTLEILAKVIKKYIGD